MRDTKTEKTWSADPHTAAKHRILRGYLDGWMPIQAQRKRLKRLLYIDGFAGPGEYDNGLPGSPLVAIDAAIENEQNFRIPVTMLFIEKDPERYEHLRQLVESQGMRIAQAQEKLKIRDVRCGDCEVKMAEVLDAFESKGKPFGPALVFLDQFGYSAVSMDLISRIMKYDSCEVLSFLNWTDMNRWMPDKSKWPGIDRAFGGDDWKAVLDLPERMRRQELLKIYRQSLKERGGVKYVQSFTLYGASEAQCYWLFFCTGNPRGLEVMKKAMWKVDESGQFRYSDKLVDQHGGQLQFISYFDDDWLAHLMIRELQGRSMSLKEIFEYVLVETPCYKYKNALRLLYKPRKIDVLKATDSWRKRPSFSHTETKNAGLIVRFPRSSSLF